MSKNWNVEEKKTYNNKAKRVIDNGQERYRDWPPLKWLNGVVCNTRSMECVAQILSARIEREQWREFVSGVSSMVTA